MEQQQKATEVAGSPSEGSGRGESESERASEALPKTAKPAKRAADRAKKMAGSGKAGVKAGSGGKVKAAKSRDRAPNGVREARIGRMMSKAELARRAGLSVLTIDRVEKGLGCRMDTKRKILEALGLSLADRVRVFGEEE
jgi:DNA-binding XRE family transcriptional regulator